MPSKVLSPGRSRDIDFVTSNSQLKDLKEEFPDHPSIPLLEKVLTEFRDDELHHLDTAVENESQQAPAYALLSAVIAGGCRLAIEATKKV